ncbi:hypothetical protein C4573_06805 [Candidatus Woesearchaeota archaeon]|nr:MAG: hypothetical protein C4573_06805 [Candidatus Woesearchaeota archaeon]
MAKRKFSDFEALKAKVRAIIEKKRWKPGEFSPFQIAKIDPYLERRLRDVGYQLTGTYSSALALRYMELEPKRRSDKLSNEDILAIMGETISRETAVSIYDTYLQGTQGLSARQLFKSGIASKALKAAYSPKRKEYREGLFYELIDRLYPDVQDQYGFPLSIALRREPLNKTVLAGQCKRLYFSGSDISMKAVAVDVSSSIAHTLMTGRHERVLVKKSDRAFSDYMKHFCKLLGTSLVPDDLIPRGTRGVKNLSLIAEREVGLMLHILQKYDPELQEVPFPSLEPPLQNITSYQALIALPAEEGNTYADLRVVSANLEHLVEVKACRPWNEFAVVSRMRNQHTAKTWSDGKSIDKKLAVVLGSPLSADSKEALAKYGFHTLDEPLFGELYVASLDLLHRENPEFFSGKPYTADDLKKIHHWLTDKAHLLARPLYQTLKNWSAKILKQCIDALEFPFSVIDGHPSVYQAPFSLFEDFYGSSAGKVFAPHHLLLDIETSGSSSREGMISMIGLGYAVGDTMIVHIQHARTPFEEEDLLKTYDALARSGQFTHVVTFNGRSFDIPFINKRLLAHFINPNYALEHLDLYPLFRQYAKQHQYPNARLQTFEKGVLGASRHKDLPSKDVPEVLTNVMFGVGDHRLQKVVLHNQYDIVTLGLMLDYFKNS